MPCRHPAIVVAADLKPYERLKLFILNLGHTYLAEISPRHGGAPDLTVREAVAGTTMRAKLDTLYAEEECFRCSRRSAWEMRLAGLPQNRD